MPNKKCGKMAAPIAITGVCEYQTNIDMTIAFEREATEPTDKSNPPTEREMVMPIAIIVTMEIERRMVTILLVCRNDGFAAENPTINKTIRITVPIYIKNEISQKMKFVSLQVQPS